MESPFHCREEGVSSCESKVKGISMSQTKGQELPSDKASRRTSSYQMPDWWMVIAVFSSCIFTTIRTSTDRCYSVFYLPLMEHYDADYTQVSQLFGAFYIGYASSGFVVPVMAKYWTLGNWLMAVGLVSSLSAFLSSFLTLTFWGLVIFFGLIPGICFGIQMTLVLTVITSSVTKHKMLVLQLLFMGYGLGPFVGCPTWQVLISNFAWNGAVFIISAINLNTVVVGAVLRPLSERKSGPVKQIEEVTEQVFEDESVPSCCKSSLLRSVFEHYDLALFMHPEIYIIGSYFCCYVAAFNVSASYLIPYGVSALGMSETAASFLPSAMAIGEMTSKVIVAVLYPRLPEGKQKYLMVLQCAMLTVLLFILPLVKDSTTMVAMCILFGLFGGSFDGQIVTVMQEYFGKKYFASSNSYLNFFGFIFAPLVNLAAGRLIDKSGLISNVFLVGGALYAVTTGLGVIIHIRSEWRKRRRKMLGLS